MKKRQIFLTLLIAIVIAISTFLLTAINAERDNQYNLTVAWALLSGIVVYFFNVIWNKLLNRLLSWKKHPGLRFIVHMLTGTILSLLIISCVFQLLKNTFTEAPAQFDQLLTANIFGLALLIPLYASFFGYKFLHAWRKADLESEQLQKENTRSQMISLRNHLDPHFLFNNLNTLSSLMDIDVDLSKKYLDKFAEVYRTILRTEHSDLTTVQEEMDMVNAYIYLTNIRFKDAVFFNIDICESCMEKAIPPLTIQMLIENVLKHNIASKSKPLHINISTATEDTLIISNELQKKHIDPGTVSGTGLENIKSRYRFFTNQEVLVNESKDTFEVRVPLMEIE